MAEDGTSFENPAYEDPYGDDPYDDDRANETTPFIQQTSTPYSGVENIGMQTTYHEASGLPEKSYAETSFGPTIRNTAWEAANDLFPNMSSSELEVSYNTKGKLQVKIWGAGKKLYSLMTTDKSTGRETVNKNLSKEIKTALGQSKYEIVQQITSEKQKELRQAGLAAEVERNKRALDSVSDDLKRNKEELEKEKKSSDPDPSKIKTLQTNIRILEAEQAKAKKTLNDSYLAEKDEDALAEELGEAEENEQEVTRTAEDLRTLRRHKENLIWRKNQELDNFLHGPNLDEKKKRGLKKKN